VPFDNSGRTYFPVNGARDDDGGTDNSGRARSNATTTQNGTANVRINAIIVSGIPPSRRNQSYGGLHNFPRFIEKWGKNVNNPLYMAGSFLQLSFSNYATAPFEQEGWEPAGYNKADSGVAPQNIAFYEEPARFWGYDTALQFAPASPAATRFVTPSTRRNEFYTEPAANDAYINKLCTALKTAPNSPVPAPTKANLNCPA
jgi:hypothetical protein